MTPTKQPQSCISVAMGKAVELLPPRALEIFVTTEGKNMPHLTIDFILDIKVQSGQEVKQMLCSSTIII